MKTFRSRFTFQPSSSESESDVSVRVGNVKVQNVDTKIVSVHIQKYKQYFVGAGTVLDIRGSHLIKADLGSWRQDNESLKDDFRCVANDMKSILHSQHKALTK